MYRYRISKYCRCHVLTSCFINLFEQEPSYITYDNYTAATNLQLTRLHPIKIEISQYQAV